MMMGAMATNTLGLDDDLDGVELMRTVRGAFGLQLADEDTLACFTVGDIFRLLQRGFADYDRAGQGCAGAMAFYRLRRAAAPLAPGATLAPATRLDSLMASSPKQLYDALALGSGLRLPALENGRLGNLGGAMIALGVFGIFGAAFFGRGIFVAGIIGMAFGAMLLKVDCKEIPKNCATIGDLAKAAAALNFGRLVEEGARPRDAALWDALTEILAMNSHLKKSEICPGTWLLDSQPRRRP